MFTLEEIQALIKGLEGDELVRVVFEISNQSYRKAVENTLNGYDDDEDDD